MDFYQRSSGVLKRRILGCIFQKKLYFNEEKDATIIFTKPIEVINMIFNELENGKKEKEVDFDLFSKLAPLIDERCSCHQLRDIKIGF